MDLLNLRLFSKFAQNSVWKESSPRCQPLSFLRLLASRTSIIVSAKCRRPYESTKIPKASDTSSTQHFFLPVRGAMLWWEDLDRWWHPDHVLQAGSTQCTRTKRGVTFDTVVIWWFLWRLQEFNNHHWRNQVVQGTEGWFWMIFDVPFQASFDGEVRWLRKAPEASSGGCKR